MARSTWKGPFLDPVWHNFLKGNTDSGNISKDCWSRRSNIVPIHVGLQLRIHNGKSWIRLIVTDNMVGHKFGEFAMTRKRVMHKKKTKKKVN
jgi:small subunit ribosomal protein S19